MTTTTTPVDGSFQPPPDEGNSRLDVGLLSSSSKGVPGRHGPSGRLTQADIAAHLDLSDRSVRELLSEWGMDHRQVSLDEIRVRYIRGLREVAAGRASLGGDEGLDLVQERAALARAQREGQDLRNAVIRREHAPTGALSDALAAAGAAVVGRMDQLDHALRLACPDLPEAARHAVRSVLDQARNEWIRSTSALIDDILTDDPAAAGDVEDVPADTANPIDLPGP